MATCWEFLTSNVFDNVEKLFSLISLAFKSNSIMDSLLFYKFRQNAYIHKFYNFNFISFSFIYRFNLCRKNVQETTELCQKIKSLYATYLTNPPSEFDNIASCALDGFWYIDITADKDSFMSFTYKLHDLPCRYSISILITIYFYYNFITILITIYFYFNHFELLFLYN